MSVKKGMVFIFFVLLFTTNVTAKTADDLVKEAKAVVKEITPLEADSLIKSGGVIGIDVREPEEFKSERIKGAILIPRGLLEFEIDKKVPDKKTKIIIYCKKGGRGILAAESLIKMGYKDVLSITGGLVGWEAKGLPIVK